MFLNDNDKMIVHYILKLHCQKCGLDISDYFSYNQFMELCPHPDCKERGLIKGLIRSDHHLDIRDYLGAEYPFNEEWKQFFRLRKGWI